MGVGYLSWYDCVEATNPPSKSTKTSVCAYLRFHGPQNIPRVLHTGTGRDKLHDESRRLFRAAHALAT